MSSVARPCHECDPLSIRRPSRLRLGAGDRRESSRRARWIVHHIEVIERDERELPIVWTRDGIANLSNGEFRGIRDWIRELDLGAELDLRRDVEGDVRCGRPVNWHTPDLAAVRDDDRLG